MTFAVIFEDEAETELNDAIAYYDAERDGVGQRFSREVRAAIRKAAGNPRRFSFIGPTVQKIKIIGWPYSVYFTLLEDSSQFIVVSVFHGARNPEELSRRIK